MSITRLQATALHPKLALGVRAGRAGAATPSCRPAGQKCPVWPSSQRPVSYLPLLCPAGALRSGLPEDSASSQLWTHHGMSSSEAPSQSRAPGLGEAPAPFQVPAWPWKTAREAGPQRRELGWGLPLPPPLQGAPQASTEVGKARGPSDPHRHLPPGPSHLPSLYPAPPAEGISICSSLSCCLTRDPDPRHAGGTLVSVQLVKNPPAMQV